MSEHLDIHPQYPKRRHIEQAVAVLVRGGLIAYPTDSGYALGWRADNRQARDRVVRLRALDRRHNFTYCCRSLTDVGQYAKVSNWAYRLIRQFTPGPYTFILEATSQVHKLARQEKKRTIGMRIPDHPVVQELLRNFDQPILSSSLLLPAESPDEVVEIYDSDDLYDQVRPYVDLFVNAGYCSLEPTTVLDLTGNEPVVLRRGQGVIDFV